MKQFWDYKTQETHNLEFEKLYKHFWHFGVHKSEVQNDKDYVVLRSYDFEIVLYNDFGDIVAFYNACPHRGAALIRTSGNSVEKGNGDIKCLYHGWSYRNKKLRIGDCKFFKDAKNIDLFKLKTSMCGDFIFFAHDPYCSLDEQLGEFKSQIQHISKSISRQIGIIMHLQEANWKPSIEAFLEFYHIPFVHAQSLQMILPKIKSVATSGFVERLEGDLCNTSFNRRMKHVKTMFDSNNFYAEGHINFYLFPFSFVTSTCGYGYAIQNFFPNTPSQTHFSSRNYHIKLADTPLAEIIEKEFNYGILEMNEKIYSEDRLAAEMVQKGSGCGMFDFVYHSRDEQGLPTFHKLYEKAMKKIK
ncbi:aromatic ring-hydroxylating oxygenase subunit alpha [Helicobacter cinaedi]|uniref:aromatic ring-hydroxylating oxygenase subunit alpha n=1 Tax=Helicobacter cinaedi TaxID=213 RepID=UPI000CF15BBF|nr:SRPBCC family protein [Helicobacter cinaedi]